MSSTVVLKTITVPVKLKDASPTVIKSVQSELVRLGYLANEREIDGIPGNRTVEAFHKFKIDNYLGDLDTLGATTAAKLLGAKPQLLISEYQAETIFGRQITLNQLADLNNCCHRFAITTPARICHFIAQLGHESGGLQWFCEIASGWAYDISVNPRLARDLGNIYKGDGPKFKGGGPLQVTGRDNYQALSDFLGDKRVIEEGCAYVASHLPFTAGGHWWMRNQVNILCDRGATCRQISAKVNGKNPANGLADRERYYALACKTIG